MNSTEPSKPTILAVDDEEVIRTLLVNIFQRDGRYAVDIAADGVEALAALDARDYSVVITDLQMPRMGGIELLRRIRKTRPELPVMVFTGYGDLQQAVEALRLGAVNFLCKPFDLKEIVPAVSKAVEAVHKMDRRKLAYSFVDSLHMDISVPPAMDHAESVLQMLVDPVLNLNLAEEAEVKNVFLALDEVLINAIAYGALRIDPIIRESETGHEDFERELSKRGLLPEYRDRRVRIIADYSPEKAVFRFIDPGEGFDFENLPDPTHPENLFREHGRGLLLARCFMDDLQFAGKGNDVTLIKIRSAAGT